MTTEIRAPKRRYALTFSLKNGGWLRGEFTSNDFLAWCEEAGMENPNTLTAWSDLVWNCLREAPEPSFHGEHSVLLIRDTSQVAGFVIEPTGRRR